MDHFATHLFHDFRYAFRAHKVTSVHFPLRISRIGASALDRKCIYTPTSCWNLLRIFCLCSEHQANGRATTSPLVQGPGDPSHTSTRNTAFGFDNLSSSIHLLRHTVDRHTHNLPTTTSNQHHQNGLYSRSFRSLPTRNHRPRRFYRLYDARRPRR